MIKWKNKASRNNSITHKLNGTIWAFIVFIFYILISACIVHAEDIKTADVLVQNSIPGYYVDKSVLWGVILISLITSTFIAVLLINNVSMRRMQKELEESRERYRLLFENSPDGIVVHRDGIILMANAAAVKLMGASRVSQLTGKRVGSFVYTGDSNKRRYKRISKISKINSVLFLQQKVTKLDGKVIDVEVTEISFPLKGGKVKLSVLRDISDRRLYTETVEMDKLKTEFFSNISHELRTPLNLILSTIQVLDSGVKSGWIVKKEEHMSKYTNIIKKNCYRLIKLVNNLIDITEINCGHFKICLINHDIVSLVEGVTQAVASSVVHKGIIVLFDTEMEEKVIACDPGGIERIILNLLSNAIKFSKPDGEILVSISDMGESIKISVKDNGIGIPDDKSAFIFDKFRQADKSFTRKQEGSGIGLSLVKSLVELHNGSISLKSEYGEGSEFIIELPTNTVSEEREEYKKDKSCVREICRENVSIEFSDIYDVSNM